jgi:hypothetical protein
MGSAPKSFHLNHAIEGTLFHPEAHPSAYGKTRNTTLLLSVLVGVVT